MEKNSQNRNKVHKMDKDWDSNPYLSLQNPVALPTVLWKFLKISKKYREIDGNAEIRTRI